MSKQHFSIELPFQVLEKDEADSEQEQRWKGWSPSNNFDGLPEPIEIPEEHHHDITKIEEILAKEPLPRRVLSPGRALGLSVMLNVEESEYDCSGSESVGFKVSKVLAKLSTNQSLNCIIIINILLFRHCCICLQIHQNF